MTDLLDIKENECYRENDRNGSFQAYQKFCELIFDGIMCWTATEAGTLAVQSCPNYFESNSNEYATKKCEDHGEWYVDKHYNRKWTNYSQCWKIIDSETALVDINTKTENSTIYEIWVPIMKDVSHWGYGISLIALISAMIIFLSIKKLQCARNRLHMHLFASFIMKAFMSLLKDILFVKGIAMQSDIVFVDGKPQYIKEHYSWMCKAIVSAKNYFTLANYMLILMEGLYLHNLMFLSIFSDNSQITVYYLLGWGLPLIFIIIWVILRTNYEDKLCWTTSQNIYYKMLIQIPIALSIIRNSFLRNSIKNVMMFNSYLFYEDSHIRAVGEKIFLQVLHRSLENFFSKIKNKILNVPQELHYFQINCILFITIVRILLVKLNSMYIQRRKIKYRRLARSTLTLVPLFGVPYVLSIIMSYTPTSNTTVELIWIFCDQTFSAFQGFFVALVYCLLNSEVHYEVKQKYNSVRDRHEHIRKSRERTISHTQQFPTTIIPLQDEIFTTNGHILGRETMHEQSTVF